MKNNSLVQTQAFFSRTFGKLKRSKKDQTKSKGGGKEFIAKLSRGLMLPIAMLPIAGLFLGIGAAISTAGSNSLNEALIVFGNFLKIPGDVIFGALPILFAVAIAIAFTKDAGPAALAAVVGYLVFGGLQQALIQPVYDPNTLAGVAPKLLGYNLLFYTGSASLAGDPSFGLSTSLFGTTIGITQLSTSIVGGFIVGFTVAWLYNKYKNIQLPAIIGFFSGVRFIPIVTFLALFPITLLTMMIWPLIGTAFYWIGYGLGGGYLYGFNSFIFGYIERSLVPLGLHHAFYTPLWYTSAGGTLELSSQAIVYLNNVSYGVTLDGGATVATWGQIAQSFKYSQDITGTIMGDQSLWAFANSYLAGHDLNVVEVNNLLLTGTNNTIVTSSSIVAGTLTQHTLQFGDLTSRIVNGVNVPNGTIGVNIGQYLQGKYIFMMFGLPAAAVAMVMAAPKENRKVASSIIISAGFTSLLTGITEPLEFTFLFLAPWLFWGFHAFFCAMAFGLMNWIGLITTAAGSFGLAPHIGMTFSGGLIDWSIYGAIQIPAGSNAWWALVFGVIYIPIYYFFFLWAIKHFNIATPGRGGNTQLFTKKDFKEKQGGVASTMSKALSSLSADQQLAIQVIKAYGGVDNIKNVDACITKLRIQIADQSKVDGDKLKNELGAMGVIKPSPQSVYAVYGAKADLIKNNINEILKDIQANPVLAKDYFDDNAVVENQNVVEPKNEVEKEIDSATSQEKLIIKSPLSGKIVPVDQIPDETFSQNMMGVGIGIKPSSGSVVAPFKGKLSLVFDTNHAYTFESEKGTQVLIHIGVDSINLKDDKGNPVSPFHAKVKTGDNCNAGNLVAEVNLASLRKYAKSDITPIIILNESIFGREVKVLKKSGLIKKGEPLLEISPIKPKTSKPKTTKS